MDTQHIEEWIKTCHNPNVSQQTYRDAKERLSLVNQKDYYDACEKLGVRPFSE